MGSAGASPAVVGASPTTLDAGPVAGQSVAVVLRPTDEGVGRKRQRRARSPSPTESLRLNPPLTPPRSGTGRPVGEGADQMCPWRARSPALDVAGGLHDLLRRYFTTASVRELTSSLR